MKNWEVYTLIDPRTLRARYVGATHNGGAVRYKQHLWDAVKGGTHLRKWICSLLRLGEKPIYLALEYGQGDGWQGRERFWIATHRRFCDLVNATDGGEGTLGYAHTAEARAKMSTERRGKKRRPRSVEHRANLRAAHLGKSLTPEHRAKVGAANRGKKKPPRSAEHRANLSASLLRWFAAVRLARGGKENGGT
jgi:hypothetical protein